MDWTELRLQPAGRPPVLVFAAFLLGFICVLGTGVTGSVFACGVLLVAATVLLAMGAVSGGEPLRVKADKECDAEGNATVFTLSLGMETLALDPGKLWVQVDRYKWVTRGLIEEPQSFHVLRDGTVEINGEKIPLSDSEGIRKLEFEINKHHTPGPTRKPAPSPGSGAAAAQTQDQNSGKVRFKVRVDHLGHLMIECHRGGEKVETGLRGLSTLVQNGFMLKPASLHLDPLQAAVEIDGVRFECTEAGARQLEEALNARYAATLKAGHQCAIEIKENPASPTRFDIHFVTVRVGARFDVKGHLTQEQLDVLQDPAKCDLLQPGIVLRLSPPHLLVRRKRPDGGEERIPGLADVYYLRTDARQLEQFFNHPLIRRTDGSTAEETLHASELHPEEVLQIRIVRHAKDKMVPWLECETIDGGRFEWRAFTHHNVSELQRTGLFLPHLDVTLSLDHRTLSILNTQTNQEETVVLDSQSSDEVLVAASGRLTAALKPVKPRPAAAGPQTKTGLQTTRSEVAEGEIAAEPALPEPTPALPIPARQAANNPATTSEAEKPAGGPKTPHAAPAMAEPPPTSDKTKSSPASAPVPAEARDPATPAGPGPDAAILALFNETDPLRINTESFQRLTARFGVPAQDIRLSLPRVFENRRFEIISLNEQEIGSVLELRGEGFFGFYLSHISERRIDFVYARGGTHIEWGADKCVLQPSVTAEAIEFKGSALLGLAQNRDNQFIFVVTPGYKQWVKPHEPQCREAFAHFLTVNDLALKPDSYTFLWPERQNA
ncbi:MAG TPA: hypothetical protein VJW76_14815 [Verrucomicrobiae bacterium]|nr:hypothetical protein [Verrucomicrobiae bacterium]